MMNKLRRVILIFYCVCCNFICAYAADTEVSELKIGTMDLPPYGWRDELGTKRGIIYELNQQIGIRSGLSFSNVILPFNRMLFLLKEGKIDLISSQAYKMALEAGKQLAVQFEINVIAVARKNSSIESLGEFKGKNIIYHHSATYPQLEGLPREIHRVKDYAQVLNVLYTRPMYSAGVFSEPAYYYLLKKQGLTANDFGKTIIIQPDKKQWIFVRKDLPDELCSKLKLVIEEIYSEDLHQRSGANGNGLTNFFISRFIRSSC